MEDILQTLRNVGAVITNDHFVYTSGKHGSVYINKDALYPHTEEASKVGRMFAEKFKYTEIEAVVAPALGGIILSQWTAYHLSKIIKKKVLGLYTEKTEDKNQVFRRGYDSYIIGKRVLVIEDLTTTGRSVRKVVDSVKAVGGNVIAVCVMVNRDPDHVTAKVVGAPFSALGILQVESFEDGECPLCKKGIQINTVVGHGKKYLEEKNRKTI